MRNLQRVPNLKGIGRVSGILIKVPLVLGAIAAGVLAWLNLVLNNQTALHFLAKLPHPLGLILSLVFVFLAILLALLIGARITSRIILAAFQRWGRVQTRWGTFLIGLFDGYFGIYPQNNSREQ